MKFLAAVLLLLIAPVLGSAAVAGADVDYAAPGSSAVRTIDGTWTDAGRQRDLPVRIRLPDTDRPVPVIVFSHGLGGSLGGGLEWSEHWAAHGFAVVHVQHPGSDEDLWKGKPPTERMATLREGASVAQFLACIADIKFAVAELSRRRQAGDPVASRLDLDRLGMSGHSFGAVTALYLGGPRPGAGAAGLPYSTLSEPRFRAFLAFSPQAGADDPRQQFADFARPALLVTGTLDGQPFPGIGASAAQRLVPFDAMAAAGNKFLLVLDNADHMYFNGTRGLRDVGAAGRDKVDFVAVEAGGYRLVKAISTAYWAAYLRDDETAVRWLKDGGASALVGSRGSFKLK